MISVFRHCARGILDSLKIYATYIGGLLLTFRDNLSLPLQTSEDIKFCLSFLYLSPKLYFVWITFSELHCI